MIEVEFWYRSQGLRWPLRAGDAVILRDGTEVLLQLEAELVIELLVMHFRNLQLADHLRAGTAPRRSLAKILSSRPEAPTKDLLEARRLKRRKRS